MGIRSFGPDCQQSIAFDTPLTAIVGSNGSGKTTIVESLRYAITGDVPTRDHTSAALVYNPRIKREQEVIAEVGLRFRSISGGIYGVTRQLRGVVANAYTSKNAAIWQETVKDQLFPPSSDSADLYQLAPKYFGVSKAMLNYVIFCSQEDNLWPLSDSVTLKAIFDDIFKVGKYVEVVADLLRIQAIKIAHLEKLEVEELHAEEKRLRAEKCKRKQRELNGRIGLLRASREKAHTSLEEARQKEQVARMHVALTKLTIIQTKAEQAMFKASSKDNTAPRHELGEMHEEYEDFQQQYRDLEQRLKDAYSSLRNKQSGLGRREAQQKSNWNTALTSCNEQIQNSSDNVRVLEDKREQLIEELANAATQVCASERIEHNHSLELEAQVKDLVRDKKAIVLPRNIEAIQVDLKSNTNEIRVGRIVLEQLTSDRDKLKDFIAILQSGVYEVITRLKEKQVLAERIEGLKGTYLHSGALQEVNNARCDIKKLEIEIAGIEANMLKVGKRKKIIEDTARERALEKQEAEINKAEREKECYEAEAHHWNNQRNQLNIDKVTVERDIEHLVACQRELFTEFENLYQNATEDHLRARIEVKAHKDVIEELRHYTRKIDKAIMHVHTCRLREINVAIAELWRNTYQGTDVDNIFIASDIDANGFQRHNYRVVMVSEYTEMDMRGRCSAGQQALACIIIRLALAQCFGTTCGIISLDEPTTNLDQANIVGLANSLSKMIQLRRTQANFQLIVITHDEEFLRRMDAATWTDMYWRLGRKADCTSMIESRNIAEYYPGHLAS